MLIPFLFVVSFVFSGCASKPPVISGPSWIHQPSRTVDSGYLVYVGVGEDHTPEAASFKAEALALEDLANECSFVPKGTRIEDRYEETTETGRRAYAKVGIIFEECEAAKRAVDPESIRKLANVPMTETVKKYREMINETLEGPEGEESASVVASESADSAAPVISDEPHYFWWRQRVAYQKEVVILAAPGAYPAGAPQTIHFVKAISPVVTRINDYESTHPVVRREASPWSKMSGRATRPRAVVSPAAPRYHSEPPARVRRVPTYHPRKFHRRR